MTYLLTWSCYAKSVGLHPSPVLIQWRRCHCRYPPFRLDACMRQEVLKAILSATPEAESSLLAAHVRETHVHVILTSSRDPQMVATALKSAATRRLRSMGMVESSRPIWADFLNIRLLRTREALLRALHYVVDKQGTPMALWHVPAEDIL